MVKAPACITANRNRLLQGAFNFFGKRRIARSGVAEIVNYPERDQRTAVIPGTPDMEEELEALMCAPLRLRDMTFLTTNEIALRTRVMRQWARNHRRQWTDT